MKKMILMTALAGAFGYSILPSFGLRHYQSLRRRKNNEGRILYLTFDDGPSEAYTEALLDLLDEYDIKASFFVVAEFAQKNPRIILRAKKEGHLIGIHSVLGKEDESETCILGCYGSGLGSGRYADIHPRETASTRLPGSHHLPA